MIYYSSIQMGSVSMSIISDIQKLLAKEQISEAENLLESKRKNIFG